MPEHFQIWFVSRSWLSKVAAFVPCQNWTAETWNTCASCRWPTIKSSTSIRMIWKGCLLSSGSTCPETIWHTWLRNLSRFCPTCKSLICAVIPLRRFIRFHFQSSTILARSLSEPGTCQLNTSERRFKFFPRLLAGCWTCRNCGWGQSFLTRRWTVWMTNMSSIYLLWANYTSVANWIP